MRRPLRTIVACSLLVLATVARADEMVGPTLPPPADDDTSQVSPRSTLRGFLAAARDEKWDTAAQYLNLANLPARACVQAQLGSPKTLVEIVVTAAK